MSEDEKEQFQNPQPESAWFSASGIRILAGYRIWILAAIWLCVRGYTLWGLTPNFYVEGFFKLTGDWLVGYIPYADFQVAHPPGALLVLMLPKIFAKTPLAYGYGLAFLMLLADVGLLLVLPRILALVTTRDDSDDITRRYRGTLVCLVYILLTSVFGRLLFQGYDLLLALLLAAAIYCALRGKGPVVDIIAAVAVWVNLAAVVWLPLLWCYGAVSGGDDRAASGEPQGSGGLLGVLPQRAAVAAGSLAVLFLPFFLLSGSSLLTVVTAGFSGGLQIESTAAGILMVAASVFDLEMASEFTQQAMHLSGGLSGAAAAVCTVVSIVVFVVITVVMARRLNAGDRQPGQGLWLIIGLLATQLGVLSTARVFMLPSLVWVCPLAAVLALDGRREIGSRGWHLLGVNLLGAVIFYFFYPNLIELQLFPALLLLIRNVLVIWLVVSLLQRAAGRGKEREPLIRMTDRTRRYLLYLPVVLLFLWGTIAAFRPVRNADIWMHLRVGADIVATGEIPKVDPYSAVAAGRPYLAHEWLSALTFHGIYRLGGGKALTVFRALTMLAMLLLLWFSLEKRARSFIITVPLLALVAYIILERVFVRPHVFTLLFLCIWMFCLERWRRDRRVGYLILLVPLQVLWANLHGAYIFAIIIGVMMTVTAAFLVMVPSWSREESFSWSDVRTLALLTMACMAASLINPHGVGLVKFSLTMGLASDYIKQFVYEWGSPLAAEYLDRAYGGSVVLSIFSLMWLGLALNVIRRPLLDAGFALLATVMTVQAIRFVSFIGILGFPIMVRAWLALADTHARPAAVRRRPMLEAALFSLILVSTLIYGFPYDKTIHRRIGWGFGGRLPYQTVNFLAEKGFEGNIYNNYADGAYILHHLHPRIRPVMDSRIDLYGSELSHEYFSSRDDPVKFFRYLNKYSVSFILLMQTKKNIPVIQLLSQLPAATLLLRADDRFLFSYNPDLLPPQLKQQLAQ